LKKIEQANECEDEFSIFLGELERIIPEIAQSSSTPDQYY